jgi:SAM-dependent MidA family methyltransferase
MACELLAELERLGALPEQYAILELSADLRERQRALFMERIPHLLPRIAWLDRLPSKGFTGLVIANELLDAMPVHRVIAGRDAEEYVCWRDGRFAWSEGPLSDAHRVCASMRCTANSAAITSPTAIASRSTSRWRHGSHRSRPRSNVA